MATRTIELKPEWDALLSRAAAQLHMTPDGAALTILATALLHSRNKEIALGLQQPGLDRDTRVALMEEADEINDLIDAGILPLDHPERLELPLQVDVVRPVLAPEDPS